MSLFSCTFLSLGFFLLMASIQVLAMDDPNNPNNPKNVWIPTSHLVPFDQRPTIDLNALPEHNVPIPESLVYQGRETADSSSESHPITPDSSSGTQERGADPNDWPSILYPKTGAPDQTIPGSSSSRIVPAIQDRHDIPLITLQPDSRRFRSVEYPLWSPELQHLYADDGSEPADFLERSPKASATNRRFYLEVKPVRFYPDPKLLTPIQNAILERLRFLDIPIGNPNPLNEHFFHGQWLLPPLEMTRKGPDMPYGVLNSALANVVQKRFRKLDNGPSPSAELYRLNVQVEGKVRHILAATAPPGIHGDMPPIVGGAKGSHLYLFYESRTIPAEHKNALAILGGMYLPSEAREKLRETNFMAIVARPE
ncbi:uncharacterized protein UTRI_10397 [Ustilago trichophora]|uniref:Effector family protein Eff1 n=1 Tax=Ustilago trichophora TaxID=86804 RepID=A0A5C3EAS2_9BASI|nr:uncharacterized protein UTRI_10397 [Ustilago trichophora]